MKKTILFLLVCSAGLAQTVDVHRNLAAHGAVLGAVAGAIIGNNSGHGNGAQGAVIGAAAGAILGASAEQSQSSHADGRSNRYYRPAGPRYGYVDPVGTGIAFGAVTGAVIGGNSGHRYIGRGALYGAGAGALIGASVARDDYYYYQPSPEVRYATPQENAVTGGAFFGALAGAVIGNNSGRGNGGRGALIGAGIGALLGALSTPEPRYESRQVTSAREPNYASRVSQPQQVMIINNYYASAAPTTGGYRMDAPADGR